jgi:nucleotide-binding universal stress UspA family protein
MKKLLIATDQGELSDRIVLTGLGLARKLHLPVDIVTIVDQASVFSEPGTGMVLAEAFEDQYQQSKDHLEGLKNSNPDIDITVDCQTGEPKNALVDKVHEEDICMMVIGTHGHSRFGRLQMGSTAEYIIGHASIPIVVVPLEQHH